MSREENEVPDASTPPGSRTGYGTAAASFVVIASMVGGGVLTTSGYTSVAVHSNTLMLGLWVVGGLVALCGALTIAELASALPVSGGDYVFLKAAYGDLPAFLSGWVSFLIGFGGPIAVTALASASYLLAPFGLVDKSSWPWRIGLAASLIVSLTAVHVSGRRASGGLQVVATLVKLALLGGLAVAGNWAARGHWGSVWDVPEWSWETPGAMLFALVYISYAYTGWNAAGYIAGEIDEPSRRVPRSILLGFGIVALLYLGLNTFYALALPVPRLEAIKHEGQSLERVAQLAAAEVFRGDLSNLFSAAIGLTLVSSLSAYILTGPRVAHAMAKSGHFPAPAARLSSRGVPALATWSQSAWALLLLMTGGAFRPILEYASVGLALFSMLTISSVYVLRWRRPDLIRPFRVPAYPVTPAIFLIATGGLTAAAFWKVFWPSTLALATILAGVPAFYALRRSEGGKRPDPRA